MSEWAFLTNHALVLSFLARHPQMTGLALALAIGITERAIRKIIADLAAAGYVQKRREGRRVRYSINPDLPLRHPAHLDTAVGDLLKALGWQGRGRQRRALHPQAKVEHDLQGFLGL